MDSPSRCAGQRERAAGAARARRRAGGRLLVEQAGSLSLSQGHWKYIAPSKGPKINPNTKTELGNDPEPQLYDLAADEGEQKNLTATHPEKVREMAAVLDRIRGAAK